MNIISFLKRRKKKQNIKFKYELQMKQVNSSLAFSGKLSKEDFFVKELWLFSREKTEAFLIQPNKDTGNAFSFDISLDKLAEKLQTTDNDLYDWYIKVQTTYENLSEARKEDDNVKLFEADDAMYAEYFLRLGRFQHTDIGRLDFYYVDDDSLINYITTKGNISLSWNKEPDSPTRIQIDRVKHKNTVFGIEGKLFTRNAIIDDAQFVIRGRDSLVELDTDQVELTPMEQEIPEKYGLKRYKYKAQIDLSSLNTKQPLEHDIYDLYFKFDMHDKFEPKMVRIGRPTFRARFFISDLYAKGTERASVINPYYTFKQANLSLEVYQFSIDTYTYLRKMMRWAWLVRLINRKHDVWLIGERSYKAQDTGLAFFRYVRQHHPERKAYYVIEKDSPERKNAEKYGNVLEFGSKEHIKNAIIAKKVISSHHPDYLYPIRTPSFKAKVKADKVFLQHGVMGTKNMVANYGKDATGFDTDLFLVSSDFEKEMIVNDFGYRPAEVFVTGLSRFDTLFEKDVAVQRQVLIIPTWRDWIVTDDVLLESEYYERYKQLINSRVLRELAEKWHFKILFCLHPNMQKFSKYFENDYVQVINQGEVDVQHLIKESALMITDYSSVGFDFSFLHKPVIYYQFDRYRFIGKRPSHLDLDNDLPGEICTEPEEIMQLLDSYASADFHMKPEYIKRANKFIKYRDQHACERIYDVIEQTKVNHRIIDNPKITMLAKGVFRKFRRSSYYFPTMRLFYNIGRRVIPVDDKLILFESGVGKQYSDSPRKIYEEILERGLDYKKVWVYNKRRRFMDENTIKVKRLSPKYYYYLLKARYWVNNQNFPTYIQKRPATTYLQTWHGTPLKKMLYDIEEIHGRSDDYLERVSNAVKNWDYLVSPSDYATKAFRSAFRYDGEVLEVGYPRNDIFYHADRHQVAKSVRSRLGIDPAKKIILYAPTFRDDQISKKNKFSFDLNMNLYDMQEKLGDDYVVLLRMHVVVSSKLHIDEELQDFVWNVSGYPDIQELLLISDILITDYSSVMFDFANTGKPMLFYTYDFEHYRDDLRGFYFDFEDEAPGPFVYDTDEIIANILRITDVQAAYKQKYHAFQKKFCQLEDGKATKRVVDRVFASANLTIGGNTIERKRNMD
ncbi:CDP-glycerol glycerophosphotransferase family protein [Virgibacillus sp. 179-BFC.A HS]|uniref:CDP-glycerol glycerophosphotransferase family protein n=1 Tax=Tigheibacillus jepli TaxID=3035914 RepID=A0ABU5CEG9_9BACI|nr:CDP-glycerol glycerophosphotransferase family protein [Virgibacillus sp. 179-BFC.A HS]MDY0404615.1 CDP-glycerol glycerophosphotransferase family protein [Virgibacillus sp. 179-BFC.A HS]